MQLNNSELKNKAQWDKAGIQLPKFDREAMILATKKAPKWVHFGAGNIFRAFPAALAQTLLEQGLETRVSLSPKGMTARLLTNALPRLTICAFLSL